MESVATRLQHRLDRFMQEFDPKEQLLRAQQYSVELRKERRSELVKKKRLGLGRDGGWEEAVGDHERSVFGDLGRQGDTDQDRLGRVKDALTSSTTLEHTMLLLSILRKLISQGDPSFLDSFIRMDFLPIVLRHMDPVHSPSDVLEEATWLLCNLAAGPHSVSSSLVSHGSIQALSHVLCTTSKSRIQETALNALGNLALDCIDYRDMVLAAGVHTKIADIARKRAEMDLVRIAAWAIVAMVVHRPGVGWGVQRVLLPAVKALLEYRDDKVRKEALTALIPLSEDEGARMMVETGLASVVLELMGDSSVIVAERALRVVGNLASRDDAITRHLLSHNCLSRLRPFLSSPSAIIRRDAFWTLSNITAGTDEQVREVLEHEVCREAVGGFGDPDEGVRKETSFVFVHMLKKLDQRELRKLVDMGILTVLKYAFESDPTTIRNSLNIACGLLYSGEEDDNRNIVAKLFEESGCLEAVERLQSYENKEIVQESLSIIDRFFGFEILSEGAEATPMPASGFIFS